MNDQKLFHYANSGLDWVYLANGYTVHETKYGTGISIHNADELHSVIAQDIATLPFRLRGQEIRYLRSYLDLSQYDMGRLIGLSRSQVARMEAERDKPISESADRATRYFIAMRHRDRDLTDRVIEMMRESERRKYEHVSFKVEQGAWMLSAA